MASRPDLADRTVTSRQYLAFALRSGTYAMEIRSIKEVVQFSGLTEVPGMPGFVRGVCNLRGAVVPVLDLSARFGDPPTDVARRTCIVILERGDGHLLGAIVDQVKAVLQIPAADIAPRPAFGSVLASAFLAGIARVEAHLIMLLDTDRVLDLEASALPDPA